MPGRATWRRSRPTRTGASPIARRPASAAGCGSCIAGAADLAPLTRTAHLRVRASSTIHASRRILRGRGRVRFSGGLGLHGATIPRSGKLVEFQAYDRGRWRTFAHRPRARLEGPLELVLHVRRHAGPLSGATPHPPRGRVPLRTRLLAVRDRARPLVGGSVGGRRHRLTRGVLLSSRFPGAHKHTWLRRIAHGRAACRCQRRNGGMSRSSSRMASESRWRSSIRGAAVAGRARPLLAGGADAAVIEAGGDHRHADVVAHSLVDHRAEDDVRVGVGRGVDQLGRLVDLEQPEVTAAGDVEQDAGGALDGLLEQRRGDRLPWRPPRRATRRWRCRSPSARCPRRP